MQKNSKAKTKRFVALCSDKIVCKRNVSVLDQARVGRDCDSDKKVVDWLLNSRISFKHSKDRFAYVSFITNLPKTWYQKKYSISSPHLKCSQSLFAGSNLYVEAKLLSWRFAPYRNFVPAFAKLRFARRNEVPVRREAPTTAFRRVSSNRKLEYLYTTNLEKMSFLSSDLANLTLSSETYAFLKQKDIHKIGSLAGHSQKTLFQLLNKNRKMFAEIKRCFLIASVSRNV